MTSRSIRVPGALRRLVSCIALSVGSLCAAHAFAADAPAPGLRTRLGIDTSTLLPFTAPAETVEASAPARPAVAWKASLDAMVVVLARERGQVDAELECMAKAVHREAGGQPLSGQLAVAQVIENRMRSGRFPHTACSVVNQPGQFFSTRAYAVAAGSRRWLTALAVARAARTRSLPEVVPGALFFHAASLAPPWTHKRFKLAQVGGQVFYR